MEWHFPAQLFPYLYFTKKLNKLGDFHKSIKKVIEPDKIVIHMGSPYKIVHTPWTKTIFDTYAVQSKY